MQDLLFAIALSFVLSASITFLVLRLAKKYNLAQPLRDRDVHTKAVPRIGGLAILLTFFLVVFGYQLYGPASLTNFGFPFAIAHFSIDKRLLVLLLGGLVLVIGMLIDDINGLRAYQKLGIQFLVALLIILGGIGVNYLNNPLGGTEIRLDQWQIPVALGGAIYHFVVLADALTVLWLILLMNVLNFSDGVDGLAGTIAASALFVIMILSSRPPVLQSATSLVAAVGFGAVLGFLVWNVKPAKIFMGDAGAMFLGFLIGVLGIISGGKLATTLAVLAIPILDALLVIVTRLIHGKNPFTHADQSHIHHRFLKAGFSVRQTVLSLGLFSLLFGLAAIQNTGAGKIKIFGLALVLFIVTIGVLSLLGRRKKAGTYVKAT